MTMRLVKSETPSKSIDFEFIKQKVDIVELIRQSEPNLRPVGKQWTSGHESVHESEKGQCLSVDPEQGLWNCFHCQKGGTVIDWLMELEGLDPVTACIKLSQKNNLPLPFLTPEQQLQAQKEFEHTKRVRGIIQEACKFYHGQSTSEVREYLSHRGLKEETIQQQLIGYAPSGGTVLFDHLTSSNQAYSRDDLLATGLFHSAKGRIYDHYQDRILFPYWLGTEIIYSIGRVPTGNQSCLEQRNTADQGKYKKHLTHSTSHPYISSTAVVHGIYGQNSIKGKKEIIITEGVLDALLAQQAGFGCLSPNSNRFSQDQIQQLVSLAQPKEVVYLINDNEESGSGLEGAKHTSEALFQARIDTRIVTLPKDPNRDKVDLADFLQQATGQAATELTGLMSKAEEYLEFRLRPISCLPTNKCIDELNQLIESVVSANFDPIKMGQARKQIIKNTDIGAKAIDEQIKECKSKLEKGASVFEKKMISPEVDSDNNRPTIAISSDLQEMSDQCLEVLLANSKRPSLFRVGDQLFGLSAGPEPEPILLNKHKLRGILDRKIIFTKVDKENRAVRILPPIHVVEDLLNLMDMSQIPSLDGIATHPMLNCKGELITKNFYDADTKFYFHEVQTNFLAKTINRQTATEAVSFLCQDLLGDFCFDGSASLANALSAMITPFLRPRVAGPTPIFVIHSPVEGSGKGKLVDCLTIPSTNSIRVGKMAGNVTESEWRKRITAALIARPSHIIIDNIAGELNSSALASATTEDVWLDRILGKSETSRIKIRNLWMVTGNNVSLSSELVRRSVSIRLDPGMETPHQRIGFRYPNITKFCQQNRNQIQDAILSLIRYWLANDQIKGKQVMGSYEEWVSILGGILSLVGFDTFLGNRPQISENMDSSKAAWVGFFNDWYQTFQDGLVGVNQLFRLASSLENQNDSGWLDHEFENTYTEQGQRTKLARLLRDRQDRVIGGFKLNSHHKKVQNANRWKLTIVESRTEPLWQPTKLKFSQSPGKRDEVLDVSQVSQVSLNDNSSNMDGKNNKRVPNNEDYNKNDPGNTNRLIRLTEEDENHNQSVLEAGEPTVSQLSLGSDVIDDSHQLEKNGEQRSQLNQNLSWIYEVESEVEGNPNTSPGLKREVEGLLTRCDAEFQNKIENEVKQGMLLRRALHLTKKFLLEEAK